MIDAAPTINPLETPLAKPSQIVRNWPDAMWCAYKARVTFPTGQTVFCAIGILNEVAGYDWGEEDRKGLYGAREWDGNEWDRPQRWFRERYGLSKFQAKYLAGINDSRGKYAAADYLESLGM